jgi:hypothetical protein
MQKKHREGVDDKHPLHTRLQHALVFDWEGKKSGQADSLLLCGCRTHVALVSCHSPGMLRAYNQGSVSKKVLRPNTGRVFVA